jgi:hypothetical protein
MIRSLVKKGEQRLKIWKSKKKEKNIMTYVRVPMGASMDREILIRTESESISEQILS